MELELLHPILSEFRLSHLNLTSSPNYIGLVTFSFFTLLLLPTYPLFPLSLLLLVHGFYCPTFLSRFSLCASGLPQPCMSLPLSVSLPNSPILRICLCLLTTTQFGPFHRNRDITPHHFVSQLVLYEQLPLPLVLFPR